MEKLDVFVWMDGEDGAGASVAVRALKAKMKISVDQWFLLGAKSERMERVAYDLGMHPLIRPAGLGGLGALASVHGTSPAVLFWSAEAVLVADWMPWQGSQMRLWESCPAALLKRADLPGAAVETWAELQKQTSWPRTSLPAAQVKVLPLKEFEKAAHGVAWPFGPSVAILEKQPSRR